MNLNNYFQHSLAWGLGCLFWVLPLCIMAQVDVQEQQQAQPSSASSSTTFAPKGKARRSGGVIRRDYHTYSIGASTVGQGNENNDGTKDPDVSPDITTTNTVGALSVSSEDPMVYMGDQSCPKLYSDVVLSYLLPCAVSTASINYCNQGTTTAYDAYIDVTLDPALTLDSTTLPYTAQGTNIYRFQLGTVPAGDCYVFDIWVQMSCDSSLLGDQFCIESHIYPDTVCAGLLPNSPIVLVDGECLGTTTKFRVNNQGMDLTAAHQVSYIIIDDHLLTGGNSTVVRQGTLNLRRYDNLHEQVTASRPGPSNYRLEIRDNANKLLASSVVGNCADGYQAQVSNFHHQSSLFWNGSAMPAIGRGCQTNGHSGTQAGGSSNPIYNEGAQSGGSPRAGEYHFTRVRIAPNPMSEQATVFIENAENSEYLFELYDAVGQRVMMRRVRHQNRFVLHRENWTVGMYYYRLSTGGETVYQGKIVLQ